MSGTSPGRLRHWAQKTALSLWIMIFFSFGNHSVALAGQTLMQSLHPMRRPVVVNDSSEALAHLPG